MPLEWEDRAIVLSATKYGETSMIVRLFTSENGVHGGLIKGLKKNSATCQKGNIVNAIWKARLADSLGYYNLELKNSPTSLWLRDSKRLITIQAMCELLVVLLPEREPHHGLFREYMNWLNNKIMEESWLESYAKLEIFLLQELGYALDLNQCAATGVKHNLKYISPKTGRVVSAEAGEPYKDKLFNMPKFLINSHKDELYEIKTSEIIDALKLSRYFLEKWVLNLHNLKLPTSRIRLEQLL